MGSIKQTNTFQVLVSETVPQRRQAKNTRFEDNPASSTVTIPARLPRHDTSTRNRRKFKLDMTDPDLLIIITKQTGVNERHSLDLKEPQPSSSDSQPASLQPVSETTTSGLFPVPHLEAQAQRAPVPVALIVLHLKHHLKVAPSHLRVLWAQRQQHQPVHCISFSLELLEMECSFNTLLTGTREKQGHAVMRSQMGNIWEQQQCITVLKQVAMQPQNQPRPVSRPSPLSLKMSKWHGF